MNSELVDDVGSELELKKNRLSKRRWMEQDWYTLVAIPTITAIFVLIEWLVSHWLVGRPIKHWLGIGGVTMILAATIWTSFGTRLSKEDKSKLRLMGEAGKLDASEVVRLLIANSNFVTGGIFFIALGSIATLADLLLS